MSQKWDMAGNDLVVNGVYVGASTPGSAGTLLSGSEVVVLDGVTAGTVTASKAVVVDASKKLSWSVSDTTGSITLALTATGTGSVDGATFSTTTAASLGNWANAVNAKLDFGSAGKVTGLGGAMCAELDLGAGTTSGSYAVFEGELVGGTNASTGSRTSFFSLNASGTVTNIDANAHLFDLNGLTAGSTNLFNNGLTQVVTASARLKIKVGSTLYYIPLCAAAALTS